MDKDQLPYVVDQDWRAQKEYILRSLEALGAKVDAIQDCLQEGLGELRTDVALLKQSQAAHLSEAELEMIITGAMARKKDSQTLTRDDIRRIAEESVKAKNGHNGKSKSNGVWDPWKYVLLGGALGFGSNVFLKAVEILVK